MRVNTAYLVWKLNRERREARNTHTQPYFSPPPLPLSPSLITLPFSFLHLQMCCSVFHNAGGERVYKVIPVSGDYISSSRKHTHKAVQTRRRELSSGILILCLLPRGQAAQLELCCDAGYEGQERERTEQRRKEECYPAAGVNPSPAWGVWERSISNERLNSTKIKTSLWFIHTNIIIELYGIGLYYGYIIAFNIVFSIDCQLV